MFFCKEKCDRISAMKKFILALVLVVMVGMDVGVAWAEIKNQADADACASGGGKVVGSECVTDSGSTPSIDCQKSGGSWVGGECVTNEKFCSNQEQVWDPKSKSCKTFDEIMTEYCKSQGLEHDPVAGKCYRKDEQSTLLPGTAFSETQCEELFTYDASHLGVLRDVVSGKKKDLAPKDFLSGNFPSQENVTPLDVLGCSIKTGRVKLWMIPFFVKYLIQFAISIAGLVAVGAIIIGGYFYLFSGLDNDKERGKKAIMYGLLGFIVVLLAWTIVNAAIGLFTR